MSKQVEIILIGMSPGSHAANVVRALKQRDFGQQGAQTNVTCVWQVEQVVDGRLVGDKNLGQVVFGNGICSMRVVPDLVLVAWKNLGPGCHAGDIVRMMSKSYVPCGAIVGDGVTTEDLRNDSVSFAIPARHLLEAIENGLLDQSIANPDLIASLTPPLWLQAQASGS